MSLNYLELCLVVSETGVEPVKNPFIQLGFFLILKNAMIKIYSDNEKIDPIMSHSNRS